jgi:hypothetical protein
MSSKDIDDRCNASLHKSEDEIIKVKGGCPPIILLSFEV